MAKNKSLSSLKKVYNSSNIKAKSARRDISKTGNYRRLKGDNPPKEGYGLKQSEWRKFRKGK